MQNRLSDKTRPSSSSSSSSSSSLIMWLAAASIIWNLLTSSSYATSFGSRDFSGACLDDNANGDLRILVQRCHPNESREVISCGNERRTLSCSKGGYIAVHSAAAGRSRQVVECAKTAITNETECSPECAVNELNKLCFGKRRCVVGASDVTFSEPCGTSKGMPMERRFLWLLFTCVSKNVTRVLQKKVNESSLDNIECLDEVGRTTISAFGVPHLQEPIDSTRHSRTAQDAGGFNDVRIPALPEAENITLIQTSTILYVEKFTSSSSGYANTGFSSSLVDFVSSTSSLKIADVKRGSFTYFESFSEVVWVLNYISDNSEKSVLYFLLGVSLGVILLLIVLIFRSIHRKRKSKRYQFPVVGTRLTDSSTSLKWRSADSESSADEADVRGTPLGGRPWPHGRPLRAWSPSANSPDHTSTICPTQLESGPNGMTSYGPRSEGSEGAPLHPGTQSLTRGTGPHQTNGRHFYFPDPKSLTAQ